MNNPILKKRAVSNLVLFSCVIILMLIIRFNPLNPPTVDLKLTHLKKSDINTITLLRPNHADITITLQDQWYLSKPISIKANQARIENILNIVNSESVTRFPVDKLDLNEFALGASPVTLILNRTELKFGDTDPIDQQRYVLIGETLHLIDDIVYPIITSNIGSLIDNKLLFNINHTTEFQLNQFNINQNSEGHWSINNSKPNNTKAISAWIDRWQQVHALYIKQQTLPGISEQAIKISSAHHSIEFQIIQDSNTSGLYRNDLGLMYYLSDDVLKQLISAP